MYPHSWPKSLLHAASHSSHMTSTPDLWSEGVDGSWREGGGGQLAEFAPCTFAACDRQGSRTHRSFPFSTSASVTSLSSIVRTVPRQRAHLNSGLGRKDPLKFLCISYVPSAYSHHRRLHFTLLLCDIYIQNILLTLLAGPQVSDRCILLRKISAS